MNNCKRKWKIRVTTNSKEVEELNRENKSGGNPIVQEEVGEHKHQ